ncbi:hypothetical protein [Propioniferax innocua]
MTDLGVWYTQQIDDVASALRDSFEAMVIDQAVEEVVGFGIISDPTDFTCTQAVNLKANLDAHMRQYVELGLGDATMAARAGMWRPGNWAKFGDDGSPSGQRMIRFAREAQERTQRSGEKELGTMMFWECLVQAMVQLFEDGFFAPYPSAVQVIDIVDLDHDRAPFDRWMAGINTQAAYDDYREFVASGA